MRAPTPTAAAEFAVPVRLQLRARVEEWSSRLLFQTERAVAAKRADLQALERGLGNPQHAIEAHIQRLDGLSERLDTGARNLLERRAQTVATWAARLRHPLQQVEDLKRHLVAEGRSLESGYRRTVDSAEARLKRLSDLLESYSYHGVLRRGFAVVTDAAGRWVGSSAEAEPGKALSVEFHDGKVAVTVDGAGAARSRPIKAEPSKPATQGKLF
jgi:exodeoxyribonuclease VII large subunit